MPRWPGVRLLAVTLAVGLGWAGCSRARHSTTGEAPFVSTAPTIARPADLRLVLFDQLPASYVEQRFGAGGDGPLDLAGAARLQNSHSAVGQTFLQQYAFQRGYQRVWELNGVDKLLVLRVLLMGSPQQAAAYFNVVTFGDNASVGITKFPTPGLAHASGFTLSYASALGPRVEHFVDLVRGPLFFHLSAIGPAGSVGPGDILGIARSQGAEASSMGYA